MILENSYGLQQIQEDLLVVFTRFNELCIENEIDYSVFAGTLLGAIREKGFIPWDDDVDVVMTLDNYENLRKMLNNNDEYYIDLEDSWVPRFRSKQKENGPFVDIFLLTEAPPNWKRNSLIFQLKILQGMLKKYKTVRKLSPVYKFLAFGTKTLGKLFSRSFLLKRYWETAYGKHYISDYYYIPNFGFTYLQLLFNKDKVDKGYIDVHFENIVVKAFEEYDYVLTINYGPDYMIPVKESERFSYHSEQIKQ